MADLDREKVIKGLEEAYKVIEDYVPGRYRGYSRLACCDALALLREQEPVEPSEMDVSPIRMEYYCGACRCLVGAESAIRNDVGFRHAYCPECGKKVLWHG